MKISLDTNVLHQEGFNSQSMQVLSRLAKAGAVQVYIADLVSREHDSKRIHEISSKTQSIQQNIKDIKKQYLKSGIAISKLEEIEKNISDFEKNVETEILQSTSVWNRNLCISKLDLSSDLTSKLWDDYFLGCGAFKKPKNREDIPDAVIGLCITEAFKNEKVIVICKDGQLKGHLQNIKGFILHDDLAAFIASSEVQSSLSKLDSLDANIENLKTIMDSNNFHQAVMRYISAKGSDLEYAYWDDGDIENSELLAIPSHWGLRVEGLDPDTITNVSYGSITCIAPKHYILPIEFISTVNLSFAGSYLDWVHLPIIQKSRIEYDSMDGDGICDFYTSKNSRVVGQVVIHFLEELTPDSLLAHSGYIGHDNCKLDVEYVSGTISLI